MFGTRESFNMGTPFSMYFTPSMTDGSFYLDKREYDLLNAYAAARF